MSTPDSLYELLSRSPDDWEARAVLADWFEEAGRQPESDSLRWMIRTRKRPYRSLTGTWHWFNDELSSTGTDPESDIPEAIYRRMSGREGLDSVFRDYGDLRQAEEDFYAGWERARQAGWRNE